MTRARCILVTLIWFQRNINAFQFQCNKIIFHRTIVPAKFKYFMLFSVAPQKIERFIIINGSICLIIPPGTMKASLYANGMTSYSNTCTVLLSPTLATYAYIYHRHLLDGARKLLNKRPSANKNIIFWHQDVIGGVDLLWRPYQSETV